MVQKPFQFLPIQAREGCVRLGEEQAGPADSWGLEGVAHLLFNATDDDQVGVILLAELSGFIPRLGVWGEVVTLALKREPALRAGDPGTVWKQDRLP